jgi:hypothetical protein
MLGLKATHPVALQFSVPLAPNRELISLKIGAQTQTKEYIPGALSWMEIFPPSIRRDPMLPLKNA